MRKACGLICGTIALLLGGCQSWHLRATPPGLYVQNGVLTKDGQPYRAIGVNYYDCFLRTLGAGTNTSYDAGFRTLAEYHIPFARFCAAGFWPSDMQLYQTNRTEYFRRLDGVVRSAERHGVGLIPSLFWLVSCVPDLVGEPLDQWANPQSKTVAWMRQYVRAVVTRYQASPAIWAWEFGNEFSLGANLPNAKEHRAWVLPHLGTATNRTERDDATFAMARVAFTEFATAVRAHDPHRLIVTGDSFPRPSAWHQEREGTWTRDTKEQFQEMLRKVNPDPVSGISLHAYAADDLRRFAWAQEVARQMRKPLFVGEFGVSTDQLPGDRHRAMFAEMIAAIEQGEVPLAAVWVFDFAHQKDCTITSDNARAWMLEAVKQANVRLRK
jgi:hypothetical protein